MSQEKKGTYAPTSAETISWLKEPVRKKNATTKKYRHKTVKYVIFEKIANISTDEFWKEFFTQCAYGKLPKCFDYKNLELSYRRNTKISLSNNIEDIHKEIKQFFQKHGGIKSRQDLELEKIEKEQNLKNAKTIDKIEWKDIRCNKMKEVLIMRYIYKLIDDDHKQGQVYDDIKNSLTLGIISNKNIFFKNGEIIYIKGLYYDDNIENYTVFKEKEYKKSKKNNNYKENNFHSYHKDWLKLNKNT